MPPIPIHKNDPIHPAATKPDGATPQSVDPNVPAPTRTLPVSVPATTTASADNPPLPQPGARPIPPTAAAAIQAPSSSVPAPPQPQHRPGDGYSATHITTETREASLPEQFHHPPPSDSQLAGRYTTTSTTASKPGPTTLNLGPATSQFQNEHSQGGLVAMRTSSEGERRSLEHPPGYIQAPNNAPYTTGGGIGSHESGGTSDSGVGGAAWNMLTKAGEALKKGEEAAWRAVRNK